MFPLKAGMEFVSYEIDPKEEVKRQGIRRVGIEHGYYHLYAPEFAKTDRFAPNFFQLEPDFAKEKEERQKASRLTETPAGKRGA